ncbi:MAG TPA: NAD(P)H-hydrate dehydratase [Rhodanobacteraceae bacterium]|jgi:NAD(P)H-hydrate epimerase|nr:NAD(P)H-hydrate dehydratase [Rhodanobacteraceae bacterium]
MTPPDPTVSLYTAEQTRRIDRAAIDECGIPGFELMQRAADAVFATLRRIWPDARRIAVLAGRGNNGGDAWLVGRLALQHGLDVDAFVASDTPAADAAKARSAFVDAGGTFATFGPDTDFSGSDVIVDGIFGTGLARAVEGEAAALIERVNASGRPVLAIDIPSGLSADTGMRLGVAIRAEATVSLVAWKRGLFTGDAADCVGARELAPLDVPAYARVAPDATLITGLTTQTLAPRRGNVDKSHFGHVLAIGGDIGMGGAIRLTGEAALRCGAGLVSVATRSEHVAPLIAGRPELMVRGIDDARSLENLLARASVVAIGPGLGRGEWGTSLWRAILAKNVPLVVDADALNLLARDARTLPNAVLTPHPGEAARLLGCETAAVQADRFAAVRALADRYSAVVVLKGAGTLVGAPDGRVAVCPWGNAGMATAGMGDVLTGVIAALIAQGLPRWDAACSGVALHARAGDLAAGSAPRGLIASDLFLRLRELVNGSGA